MEIPEQWTFSTRLAAEGFDSHVREQLPWYDLATSAVSHIAKHYIGNNGLVYDIGASTGNVGRAIGGTILLRNASLMAIDNSDEMAKKYNSTGEIIVTDAVSYDYKPYDLCVCFLSLMFIDPSVRGAFISRLKSMAKAGGALVIVDKCEPVSGYPSIVLSRLALAEKLKNGTSAEDIISKELSLCGVQRPINVAHLAGAVEFFRFGDFAGWIIEGSYESS